MRILDENNAELTAPDLSSGRLVPDTLLVAHHDAVEAVQEQGHYETVAEYPNGGRDVVWVVDVPGVEAEEAWDEYEDIQRYVPYTGEELAEQERLRNQPTMEDRLAALEAAMLEMMGVTENG